MKSTLNTFGTFSTPTFAGVGEPYVDSLKLEARLVGRQFVTNKQRRGQTGDNWNTGQYGRRTGFHRLFEKDAYVDPHTHARKYKLQQKALNLTENGFRYSTPNAKSSGLGGHWGAIGGANQPQLKHMAEYEVLGKEDVPLPVEHQLRQVQTNPPKKGYGHSTPGTTFGPPAAKGEEYNKIGKEFEHSVDPYEAPRMMEIEERKKEADMMAGNPAFKKMSHSLDFFDGQKSVASSKVFTEDPRIPERPATETEGHAISAVPFYPSRYPKSGMVGAFGETDGKKFPVYQEDPLDDKTKKAKEISEEEKAKIMGVPFKPTSNPKTVRTPTVIFHVPGKTPANANV